MRYTWDEGKAAHNLRVHKITFEDAVKIFEWPTLERINDRFDYPENVGMQLDWLRVVQ